MKQTKQTFLNDPSDCKWLLETHFKPANLNNEIPFEFKSFCLFGNEDSPTELLIYKEEHPLISDKPARAMLMGNSRYTFYTFFLNTV